MKPAVARKQLDMERDAARQRSFDNLPTGPTVKEDKEGNLNPVDDPIETPGAEKRLPKRFHGTVILDHTRVGRDASRIADEVVAHLSSLVGAQVTVALEVEAAIPGGASDQVVRTVTENARTLKFTSQGFEKD